MGISVEDLARIFQHGFTTRRDGHGFGLHGAITAAREMGRGAHRNQPGPRPGFDVPPGSAVWRRGGGGVATSE
jgi:signal transduction histidine kinase